MKQKTVIGLVLVVALLAAVAGVALARPAPSSGQTYHWQLEQGDDAYLLCAGGHLVVDVNGADSVHFWCVPNEVSHD